MKVVPSKNDKPTKKAPLLPLVPDPLDEMSSENSISYSLRTDPTDADSSTYKKYVRVLDGSENPRTVLKWAADTAQVLRGLNVTNGPNQYQMLGDQMTSSALAIFRQKAETLGVAAKAAAVTAEPDATARRTIQNSDWTQHLTADMVKDCKKEVVASLLPSKIVAMVKRYLRRECRKPSDMKVRTYYQHLIRINNDELPALPPFRPDQNLQDDEIIDILMYGTPKSWTREMDRQGYDPLTKTVPASVPSLFQSSVPFTPSLAEK